MSTFGSERPSLKQGYLEHGGQCPGSAAHTAGARGNTEHRGQLEGGSAACWALWPARLLMAGREMREVRENEGTCEQMGGNAELQGSLRAARGHPGKGEGTQMYSAFCWGRGLSHPW